MKTHNLVFDSSAVRDIGEFPDEKWKIVQREWIKLGLTTAWIPIVLSEVLGTNLLGAKKRGEREGLEDIVRSVKRFDYLAKNGVLPGMEYLIRSAFYRFADRELPPDMDPYTPQYQELIGLGKQLTEIRMIDAKRISDSKIKVGIRIPHTKAVQGVIIPEIFGPHVGREVEKWKARLNGATYESEEQINRILGEHMYEMLMGLGRQNEVPEELLAKLSAPELMGDSAKLNKLFSTTFAYTAVLQQRYYVERALGKTFGAIEENTGRDLIVASYLSCGQRLVVSDRRHSNYLKRFTEASSVISTSQWLGEFGINW